MKHLITCIALFTCLQIQAQIGIGTTTPEYMLDVVGGDLRVKGSANNRTTMSMSGLNGSHWTLGTDFNNDSRSDFYIEKGGTGTLFVINEYGNFGIGTTSPQYKLDVQDGEMRIKGNENNRAKLSLTGSVNSNWSIGTDFNNNGGNDFYLEKGGTGTLFVINEYGNFGLGTTTPNGTLDVKTDEDQEMIFQSGQLTVVKNSNAIDNLRLENRQGASADIGSSIGFYGGSIGNNALAGINANWNGTATSDAYLAFNTMGDNNLTERMRISSAGNVGIGVSNPAAALQIKAGTDAAGSAPLKFVAGANLAIPEAGAVEFDGTNIYFTNGAGVRQTIATMEAASVNQVNDEFTATNTQTNFTLSQAPAALSKVKMYINGLRISNAAYSMSGSTLTYIPANNNSYNLVSNDRVQIEYYF